MKEPDIGNSQVDRLADLLRLQDEPAEWGGDDLQAILEHQLAAPFDHEIARLDDRAAAAVADLQARNQPLPSVGDILSEPNPSIAFLSAIKRFGKDQGRLLHLPGEVAGVVYLAAISAALLRGKERLSDMDDSRLAKRLEWAVARPFLNDALRTLFDTTLAGIR